MKQYNSYRQQLQNDGKKYFKKSRNQRAKTDYQVYTPISEIRNDKQNKILDFDQDSKQVKNFASEKKYYNSELPQIPKDSIKINKELSKKPRLKSTNLNKKLQLPDNLSKYRQSLPSGINYQQIQKRKLSQNRSANVSDSLSLINSQLTYDQDEEDGFLQQFMKKIKKTVKYQQKKYDYIEKQKVQLVKLIKNLNQKINSQLKAKQQISSKNSRINKIRQGKARQSNLRQSNLRQSKARQKNSRRKLKTQFDYDERNFKRDQRSPSALQFQKSFVQIIEELNSNQKLVNNMQNQLDFLNKKYQGFQNSLKNYSQIQNQIQQLKERVKLKKEEISKIRKRKFLTQKSIFNIQKKNGNLFPSNDVLSTNSSMTPSSQIMSSLKDQHSELMKKRSKLKQKLEINNMHLQKIQELKSKHNVNKQYFQQLVEQMKKLNIYQDYKNKNLRSQDSLQKIQKKLSFMQLNKDQNNSQHLLFMYKSKKSKIQLLMKNIKRQDQSNKRKYYKLLKQYEQMVEEKQELKSISLKSNQVSFYKRNSQNIRIVQSKLTQSLEEIVALERKILRISKAGSIFRNRNQITNEDGNQYKIRNSDYQEIFEEKQQSRFLRSSSHQPYQKRQSNTIKDIDLSKNIKSSEASFYKTPFGQLNKSSDYDSKKISKNYQHFQNANFYTLTQEDRSLAQKILTNKNSVEIFSKQDTRERKNIGKFKKQNIISKLNRKQSSYLHSEKVASKVQNIEKYKLINRQIKNSKNNLENSNFSEDIIEEQILQATSQNQSYNERSNSKIQTQIEEQDEYNEYQQQQEQKNDQIPQYEQYEEEQQENQSYHQGNRDSFKPFKEKHDKSDSHWTSQKYQSRSEPQQQYFNKQQEQQNQQSQSQPQNKSDQQQSQRQSNSSSYQRQYFNKIQQQMNKELAQIKIKEKFSRKLYTTTIFDS